MKHTIHSTLDHERLEVLFDGAPCSLLCTYRTHTGFYNAVYVGDHSQDVIIEQDGKAAIVGLFSTEKMRAKQLLDYMEATISKADGFEYCLQSDLRELIRQATDRGGRYPLLSLALDPQTKLSLSDRLYSRISSRKLDTAFRKQLSAHTVSVDHICKAPVVVPAAPEKADPIIFPAENLPQGWRWFAYPDGSGGLVSPENRARILHLSPDARGVEYLDTQNSSWNACPNSVQDFRKQIASDISRSLQMQRESLDQKIKDSASKASVPLPPSHTKEKEPSR